MGRDICFGAKVKIKTCENEDRKKRTLPPPTHFTNTRKVKTTPYKNVR